jgi:hypothetical protein
LSGLDTSKKSVPFKNKGAEGRLSGINRAIAGTAVKVAAVFEMYSLKASRNAFDANVLVAIAEG